MKQTLVEIIAKHNLVPDRVKKPINIAGNFVSLVSIARNASSGIIATTAHLLTQFCFKRFGFSSYRTRQAATITAVASICALEVYANPSIETVAHALTRTAGATVGVLGTDYVFDHVEKLLSFKYKKPPKLQKTNGTKADLLCTIEARDFLVRTPRY